MTIITSFFLFFLAYGLSAQVAINMDGSAANSSAMLDVKSDTKGLLLPRMTQSQIEAIANPANGLLVYNSDDEHFYFYDDAAGEYKEVKIGLGTITPTAGFTCGDAFVDARDGQSYTSVQIGTQCWMAENLNIGTMISGATNQTNNATLEKYCYGDVSSNCDTYGGMYQWNEAMQYSTTSGDQGICPTGWHLPTDAEWCTMENFVDAGSVDCGVLGYRGTDVGGNLKETGTTHWAAPNTGATNSSGFTVLGTGFRHFGGNFQNISLDASFWTSDDGGSGANAYYRYLIYTNAQVYRAYDTKNYGIAVRCIKD